MSGFLACALALALNAGPAAPLKAPKRTRLELPSGDRLMVDVVDTPAERMKGLMFRRSLPKDYGMLFVFPAQTWQTFWMKNTWVSLDIVFIDKDKKVTAIYHEVRPSTPKTSDLEVARVSGLGQFVLELPAGAARRYSLDKGRLVDFNPPITPPRR
ncbi:MAG: DUF192 domain-containing protein [Elusimicrobia bacterium]|nr:DUF192 domain-containing protein [Elusimicrobiota bacterium]